MVKVNMSCLALVSLKSVQLKPALTRFLKYAPNTVCRPGTSMVPLGSRNSEAGMPSTWRKMFSQELVATWT